MRDIKHHNGSEWPHRCYAHLTKAMLDQRIKETLEALEWASKQPDHHVNYISELKIRLEDLKIDRDRKN